MITEFALINQYFARLASRHADRVQVPIGDDCAIVQLPPEQRLAVSVDTMVAGIHFPAEASADQVAQRAVAAALSDLAAMGATPLGITLSLTLRQADQTWLEDFSRGLEQVLDRYQVPLLGGDTTRGPITVGVQVLGTVPTDQCLTRQGARAGDKVYVSGTLGDGAAALALIENRAKFTDSVYLLYRFYQPSARIELGRALLQLASAAIDISDGLLADVGHIARRSMVGIRLNIDQLPQSTAVVDHADALIWALTGGDDYELCFTAAADHHAKILSISASLGVAITEIGEVYTGSGINCVDANGDTLTAEQMGLTRGGFEHFGAAT
ncbi:MAG: thiamine-monophosphate kinase [Halieaceae bacterium]